MILSSSLTIPILFETSIIKPAPPTPDCKISLLLLLKTISLITALQGAEILFYPTAIGWATSQDEETNIEQYNAWQTIQRSHAVANGVHVVSVNRVGHEQEGRMKFWGGSFISNPFGSLVYQGTHDQEEVHVETLDLNKTDQYRTHWPFLRDRRIDSYQPITKRYLDEG